MKGMRTKLVPGISDIEWTEYAPLVLKKVGVIWKNNGYYRQSLKLARANDSNVLENEKECWWLKQRDE